MSIENIVRNIVKSNWELYGLAKANGNFDYSINRQWANSMIRDGGMTLLDLPEGRVHHLDIQTRDRRSGHERRIGRSFMEYQGHLIPMGTHISPTKRDYSVYKVNGDGGILEEKPIENYFLEKCGDEITLTRVLSDDEVNQWNSSDGNLGSTHQLFWPTPTVHTAYHSITDEFVQNPHYNKAIKFILAKEEMISVLKSGSASIGTYGIQFRFREKDSVLPFDAEIVFDNETGFNLLRNGYQRWKARTNTESIENPFLHYDRFKSA